MRVSILGPNLPRPFSDKGTFHIHAEGCRDIARYRIREGSDQGGWTMDASSIEDIVEEVYGDVMGDYTPRAPWDEYESDFHFAPCVSSLPRETE